MQIEKVDEPQRFDPHWAQWWIDSGIFKANPCTGRKVFLLVIPPPNVTGVLHMGHMLEQTEIDAPGGGPECHWITRLHVEVQQFGLHPFKQAVGSPGIHVRQQLDPFRAAVQKYRQRDSVARRQIGTSPAELDGGH